MDYKGNPRKNKIMKIIFTKDAQLRSRPDQRRFRGSIYVDLWIPATADISTDRERAKNILRKHAERIPNAYAGQVGLWTSTGPDREL